MKGFYWNSRGLSDLAKYRYISDAIRDHKLDFVAVMETGKQDMSRSNLNRLSGDADFIWHCLPPRGRSGGILLGINSTVLDLSIIVEGEFFIKFHLRNRNDDFKWILMAVYGPAQDEFKSAFLSELVRTCQQNPLPTLIGGDFKIMRHSKEKNKNNFTLGDRTDDIPQVSSLENAFLVAPFTEKEIRDAIFDMDHNKAPGPDGFPAEFYQQFWDVIKGDLMQMFHDLHNGDLPLFSLNFGVITLLPKTQEASKIQQYRLICLLNVSFKIFTKVATIHVNSVDKLQTVFYAWPKYFRRCCDLA